MKPPIPMRMAPLRAPLVLVFAALCMVLWPAVARADNCEMAREQVNEADVLARAGATYAAQVEQGLEKAYKLCPRNPILLESIAAVYDKMGRTERARFYRDAARNLRGGVGQTEPAVAKPVARPAAVTQPVIEILEPAEQMRSGGLPLGAGNIAVRGRARDPNGIFAVTVNGRPAGMKALDSQTVEFSLEDILLRPGKNEIAIVATSTARGEGRISFVVERSETVAGSGRSKFPDRWALVVGISKYSQASAGITSLKYARRDAESFYNFLQSPQGGRFAEDHVLFLADERATSSALRGGIRDFLGKAGENDLVVIYFAGHGAPDPARPHVLYLLTHDSDPERLGETAFDMDEIKLALGKYISAGRVVAFVDACHSGGVSTISGARSTPNMLEAVNRYLHELARSRPGVVMFTASQSNETSWEGEQWGRGHGVFTHFLLQGMAGDADRDADRVVSLQELIDFVSDKVKQATQYKQHPTASTSQSWDPNLPLSIADNQQPSDLSERAAAADSDLVFPSYFGSVPDMGEQFKGVKFAVVKEGSPAAVAGLRPGDILVEFAGKPIRIVSDLSAALRAHNPGEEVSVTVLRGAKRITMKVKLGPRK